MKSIMNRGNAIFTSLAFAVINLSTSNIASAQDAQGGYAEVGANIEVNVNDSECFPMCKPAATPTATSAIDVEPLKETTCGGQSIDLIKQAEQLNDRVKPIKEIVGYIRSPQGLVIKLVNDHVVKIPAWVGYAVDPVGSLKNRAVGEIRSVVTERAKKAIGLNNAQAGCAAEVPQEAAPILIPFDTENV